MRILPISRAPFSLRRRSAAALARDESGSAAIEFGLVAMPFLLFVLGLIGIGLYFLANHSLQYGAEAAARKIRTGEAERGKITVGQFRQLVCDEAGAFIDCGKLRVMVEHGTTWSQVSPDACLDKNNVMTSSTGSPSEQLTKYSGSASEVVLVTLCYKWDLASYFEFLKLGSGAGGSGPAILQAATAFKSEPYNL
jgi:Flp pilus assembly protein TadG